jgi:transketolase
MNSDDLDQLAINTIRTLSIDAIQKANSGHPGAPPSWRKFLMSSSVTEA